MGRSEVAAGSVLGLGAGARVGGSRSAVDPYDFASSSLRQHAKQRRNQWFKIGQSIAAGAQDDDRQGELVDTLLKREIAINRDERVEPARRLGKQGTIVHARPAEARHRLNFVSV